MDGWIDGSERLSEVSDKVDPLAAGIKSSPILSIYESFETALEMAFGTEIMKLPKDEVETDEREFQQFGL